VTAKAVQLASSIPWSFRQLRDRSAEAQRAGVDRIHIDVMDGHFAATLSMPPAIIELLPSVPRLPAGALLISNQASVSSDSFPDRDRVWVR